MKMSVINVGINEIYEYIKQNQPMRAKAISNHFHK